MILSNNSIVMSGTHVVSVYATGLNNRDHNVCAEMKLLTRWGRDKMTTICMSFPNTTKKSLQFVPKGAVNYESKLAQATAWHREDSKPLPELVVMQANGVYIWVSRIGWVDTSPYWVNISMRRKTVLFEHTDDAFTPIDESGQFRPLRLGRSEGRVDHIL